MFGPTRALLGVLVIVVSTLPTVSIASAEPLAPAEPETVADIVPADGALLGAWAKPRGGWSRELQMRAFDLVEAAAGRTLDLAHTYYPWDQDFPSWREPWHLSEGRTPVINWNGTFTTEIIDSSQDGMIRTRARALADLDAPVMLRWFWEMDADGDRAHWVGSPAHFIAAWRHIHDIFADEGVTNVAWVWCPNAWAFTTGEAPQYYPGDDYVDWVCADGYNWAEGRPDAAWRSLTDIFADFHEWALTTGKPMMIGETGVIERHAGEKAGWIRSIPSELAKNLPGVRAVVYFHSDSIYPWWIDSSTDAAEAWHEIGQHPYMNGASDHDERVTTDGIPAAGRVWGGKRMVQR